jgi:hypothetical protein
LETLQQLPALVILQPAAGAFPRQQFADGARDLGHSQTGVVLRHHAHQFHFLRRKSTPAKCYFASCLHAQRKVDP